MSGTKNDVIFATNFDFSGAAIPAATMTADGELLIGTTGGQPNVTTLTSGAGVTITNGAGTIEIASTGGGISWTEIVASQNASNNEGYITNLAGGVTLTLPVTASVGDVIRIAGKAGLWILAQNALQTVHFGNQDTTTGIGGTLTATHARNCVELVCTTANTDWDVLSSIGIIAKV